MSELDPTTGILQAVSEAQIIEDFGKYEEITITRLDDKTVKASFQETYGEGSITGNSVLKVLIHAVNAQKDNEYWRGYRDAEQMFVELFSELPIPVTISKQEQGYSWQVLKRQGTTFLLLTAAAEGLYSLIEQLRHT